VSDVTPEENRRYLSSLYEPFVPTGDEQVAFATLPALPANLIKADVLMPDGSHAYWSTHCRHGDHNLCKLTCKGCGSPCICFDPECVHNG
jgi:hypothetical protein